MGRTADATRPKTNSTASRQSAGAARVVHDQLARQRGQGPIRVRRRCRSRRSGRHCVVCVPRWLSPAANNQTRRTTTSGFERTTCTKRQPRSRRANAAEHMCMLARSQRAAPSIMAATDTAYGTRPPLEPFRPSQPHVYLSRPACGGPLAFRYIRLIERNPIGVVRRDLGGNY